MYGSKCVKSQYLASDKKKFPDIQIMRKIGPKGREMHQDTIRPPCLTLTFPLNIGLGCWRKYRRRFLYRPCPTARSPSGRGRKALLKLGRSAACLLPTPPLPGLYKAD